jgi:hypothetical protein
MALIQIKNASILIDDEDLPLVSKYKWYVANVKYRGRQTKQYVQARGISHSEPKIVKIHRIIMGVADSKKVVDHKNGNGLDNRKENLRVCSQLDNSANRKTSSLSKNKKASKFKGVTKLNNKWRAYINLNYTSIHLGFFNTETEAANAYNKAAIILYKEFANLNKVNSIDVQIDDVFLKTIKKTIKSNI